MTKGEVLPALSQAIAQVSYLKLEKLSILTFDRVTQERLNVLTGALEVEGAL